MAIYNFKGTPEPYQIEALKRAFHRKSFGVFFEPRVGKTRVGIDFAGANYQIRGLTRCLVVGPVSALSAWEEQIPEYLPDDIPRMVSLYNTRKPIPNCPLNTLHFVIATYDQVKYNKDKIIAWGPQMIIADEVHKLKRHTSARSRAMQKLAKLTEYRLGMTGTPIAQRYTDLFGIYMFIDQSVYGKSWGKFKERYCVMGGYMNYEIKGIKNKDHLERLMNMSSIRVVRKDVLDEPEENQIVLSCDLEPKAKRHYAFMRDCYITQLESGGFVTGDLPITRIMRLQQIAGGFLTDPDTGEVECVSRSKLNLLEETVKELVNEDEEKVVIFARYTPEIKEIVERCSRITKTVCINGSVPNAERPTLIQQFNENPEVGVIVIQIGSANAGFSLSASCNVIFYSISFSISDYLQAKDRVMGRDQKSPVVNYYYLVSKHTVDKRILDSIQKGIDVAKDISDNFKYYVKGE